jgi:hypothetical protein
MRGIGRIWESRWQNEIFGDDWLTPAALARSQLITLGGEYFPNESLILDVLRLSSYSPPFPGKLNCFSSISPYPALSSAWRLAAERKMKLPNEEYSPIETMSRCLALTPRPPGLRGCGRRQDAGTVLPVCRR